MTLILAFFQVLGAAIAILCVILAIILLLAIIFGDR